jgi:hypothetical protein
VKYRKQRNRRRAEAALRMKSFFVGAAADRLNPPGYSGYPLNDAECPLMTLAYQRTSKTFLDGNEEVHSAAVAPQHFFTQPRP